jgi:hypothetical protein
MKAMVIVLTGPWMLFFLITAMSTVEWCVEAQEAIPWAWVIGIALAVIAWCICAAKCSSESLQEALEKCEKYMCKSMRLRDGKED